MARGKPLSMFFSVTKLDEWPDEGSFDELVRDGRLAKSVITRERPCRDGSTAESRTLLYAIPGEEWRIDAMILVQTLYDSLLPGWREDLERVIGLLLGYDREDIEYYVKTRAFVLPERSAKKLPG